MWLERSRKVLAQGETGTNSKRPSAYVEEIYPTHVVKGVGCYLYDTEGKKYVDFVSGLGTNLLGYDHPKVVEAVCEQARKGASFTLPHYLEVEVAEKIVSMVPAIEKVRFVKNGDDSTTNAARIARALEWIRCHS